MSSVNEILHDQITKLNYTLIPPGYQGDVRGLRGMQRDLGKMIDELGEQSSTAQGLSKIITTAEKLQDTPNHFLYLLKDADANDGAGMLIGMLKVGRKHLFLFDEHDQVCEVEPLCVLDFFVVPDRQRHGFGRLLFSHMLDDLNLSPHEMPVDGPSAKMEQFLARNYGLNYLMRQNNNFAVSPRFFPNCALNISRRLVSQASASPLGRFAAQQPSSDIASVIHGFPFGKHSFICTSPR